MSEGNNKDIQAKAMIDFVEFQTKELAVKEKEIDAQKHESANSKEIALASIDAQKNDRKEFRETFVKGNQRRKSGISLFYF